MLIQDKKEERAAGVHICKRYHNLLDIHQM